MQDEHKAAVALRTAAVDFGARHPVLDDHDRAGQRRNRRLLGAAVRYAMAKRPHFKSGGYSREFTPAPQGHKRYLLDRIPVQFWKEVQAKAKREKTSIRALVLTLLERWLREP